LACEAAKAEAIRIQTQFANFKTATKAKLAGKYVFPQTIAGLIGMVDELAVEISKGILSIKNCFPSIDNFFDLRKLGDFRVIEWMKMVAKSMEINQTSANSISGCEWYTITFHEDMSRLFNDCSAFFYFLLKTTNQIGKKLLKTEVIGLYHSLASVLQLVSRTFVSPLTILTQLHFEDKCSNQSSQLIGSIMSGGVSHSTLYGRIVEYVARIGKIDRHVLTERKDAIFTYDNNSPNYKQGTCENNKVSNYQKTIVSFFYRIECLLICTYLFLGLIFHDLKGKAKSSIFLSMNLILLVPVDQTKVLQFDMKNSPVFWRKIVECSVDTILPSSHHTAIHDDARFSILSMIQESISTSNSSCEGPWSILEPPAKAHDVPLVPTGKQCTLCHTWWGNTKQKCDCCESSRTTLKRPAEAATATEFRKRAHLGIIDHGKKNDVIIAFVDPASKELTLTKLNNSQNQQEVVRDNYVSIDPLGNKAYLHTLPGLDVNPCSIASTQVINDQ
jgi:hypothetical protein